MTTLGQQRLPVSSEYDLISLRQAVRVQARAAGLGPPQQARFTAAVSELARVLLHGMGEATFTIGVAMDGGGRQALEVSCAAASGRAATLSRLYDSPSLDAARHLVDDARLVSAERGPQVSMRMWLSCTRSM
jgi:hypothetical protein